MCFLPIFALAQKPFWANYNSRTLEYPEDKYFVAFVQNFEIEDIESKDKLDIMVEMAKAALVQQIQVEVNSAIDIIISSTNDIDNETFKMNTSTLAKADIAGLRTDRYYDKKSKEAYAIAWAKKSELHFFYKNTCQKLVDNIRSKKLEAETFLKKNDKQQSLKSFYEAMPLFIELAEAQSILIALGENSNAVLLVQEGNSLQNEIKGAITDLQKSEMTSIDDMAFFMATALSIQMGDNQEPISIEKVSFDNTNLLSEFSNTFNLSLTKGLIKAANYTVKDVEKAEDELNISGTYYKLGNNLVVNCITRKEKKILASADISIPITWLRENKINWVPVNFLQIEKLENIKLLAETEKITASVNRRLSTPLKVKVLYKDNILENVPLIFYNGEQKIGEASSNSSGIASLNYTPTISSLETQTISVVLDYAKFTNIDPTNPYLTEIKDAYPILSAKFLITVKPLTIYIQDSELSGGTQLSTPIIEPAVKETLAKKGFAFTNDISLADIKLSILATSRKNSTSTHGFYFSYVDVNVSIIDLSNNLEMWKQAFSSVKGGGIDYQRADIKAYETAAGLIKDAIPDLIK